VYTLRNSESDEELEKIIREKHNSSIETSEQTKTAMSQFFKGIRDPNKMDKEQEQNLSKLLVAGKEENFKRHHNVDSSLYGTEEGFKQAEKLQQMAKYEAEAKKKLKKKKKKKQQKLASSEDLLAEDTETKNKIERKTKKKNKDKKETLPASNDGVKEVPTTNDSESSLSLPAISKEKASVAAMIIAATAVGFLMGDKRSR